MTRAAVSRTWRRRSEASSTFLSTVDRKPQSPSGRLYSEANALSSTKERIVVEGTEMRPRSWRGVFLASLAVGVGLGILVSVLMVRDIPSWRPTAVAVEREVEPGGKLSEEERATIHLFRSASNSVAFITTSTER